MQYEAAGQGAHDPPPFWAEHAPDALAALCSPGAHVHGSGMYVPPTQDNPGRHAPPVALLAPKPQNCPGGAAHCAYGTGTAVSARLRSTRTTAPIYNAIPTH